MTTGLSTLTYTSEAIRLLTRAELEHLLSRARARNEEHKVTGVLLYSNGFFIQYIEGPPAGFSAIWEIILADPLHHKIDELARESVRAREFAEWSMAFRAENSYGMTHPMQLDALLSGRFVNYGRAMTKPIEMLLKFWNLHRGESAF